MADLVFGIKAEDEGAGKTIERLEKRIEELEEAVKKLSGTKLDIPTDPAEDELKQLRAELKKVEAAYDRALRQVDFARVIAETDKSTAATRRLARANQNLAARGQQLIRFTKGLPPELRQVATGLDKVEKQAEQAQRAFKKLGASRKSVSSLVSSIGQLRTAAGALIAALGVQQILRFGRAIISMAADAVETKKKFDALIPGLRAFTGSTELAEEVAGRLALTSEKLRTPLADLIGPFLRITAATKETSLSLKEQSDLFESALLTVRAFGLGTEETSRLITGFAQVAGKGTLSMEELRQQIGEVAFNALPALSDALGISTTELFEQVSSGAISAEEALRGFATGLREANEAAGLAQLDTLKGDLGDLARVTENAQRAFADELEPGLRSLVEAATEFLETNKALIASLGELTSAGLEGFAGLVKILDDAALGVKALGQDALVLGQALDFVSFLPGAEGLSEAFTKIGISMGGAREEAKKFQQEGTEAIRGVLNEGVTTAEGILTTFEKNFREAAKAAGIATDDIEAATKDLAARVGKIQDQSAKDRLVVEEALVQEIIQFGEIRSESEAITAQEIFRIEEQAIKDRVALLQTLVEETQAGAAARILAEAKAAEETRKLFGEINEASKQLAADRIAVIGDTSDKIQQIERELAEAIRAIQEEFQEQATAENRVQLAQEVSDKIVALRTKALQAIAKEEERLAEVAKKAADQRVKDEQRIRAEIEKTTATLQDLIDRTREALAGEEGEGGSPFGQIAEDAADAALSLAELSARIEELRRAGDDLGVLNAGFQGLQDVLPPTTANFDDLFGAVGNVDSAVSDTVDGVGELGAAIDAASDASSRFDDNTAASISSIRGEFLDLVASGELTAAGVETLADRLESALASPLPAAQDLVQAVDEIGETTGLDDVAGAAEAAGEALQGTGEAAQEAGGGVLTMADGTEVLIGALEDLDGEQGAEEVKKFGDAAGESGVQVVELADGTKAIVDGLGEIKAQGEPAAEVVKKLGEASTEALPGVEGIAPPLETIGISTVSLAESLPLIGAALEIIKPLLAEIVAALTDSPVDFAELSSQIERLGEPLQAIGIFLGLIQESVTALTEPLTALGPIVEPLLEQVKLAADDDRFGVIGAGLTTIKEALPDIPEPLERFSAAIEELAGQKDAIEATLTAISDGLTAIGADGVLTGLSDVQGAMAGILGTLQKVTDGTKEWKGQLDDLLTVLPDVVAKVGELATAISGQLIPGLLSLAEQSKAAQGALVELKDEAKAATEAVVELGEKGSEALDGLIEKAKAATAAFVELRTAIEAATAAAAEVDAIP